MARPRGQLPAAGGEGPFVDADCGPYKRPGSTKGCGANGCWDDLVHYWMPFDGQIGLHDASWQTFPFSASNYHTDGSHGCIQLPKSLAAWIYHWAPLGTTVTIGA